MLKYILTSWIFCICTLWATAQNEQSVTRTVDSLNTIYQNLRPVSFDSARGIFLKALDYARQKDQKALKAKLLHRLAFIEAGEFKFISTFQRYKDMLKACTEIQDSICMGRAYSRLGHIHMLRNEYPEALENGLKGIEILSLYELKDPEAISGSLDEIVLFYWRIEEYEKALQGALRSLEIRRQYPSLSRLRSKSARMVGETYRLLNDLSNAKIYLEEALAHTEKPDHLLHASLALVAEQANDLEKSLYHHEQGIAYLEQEVGASRRPIPYVEQLKQLGDLYQKREQYAAAVATYSKAIQFARTEDLEAETGGAVSLALSAAYEQLGDYKASLSYHQLGKELMDSVRVKNAEERLAEMEIKYKIQESEQKIAYLNQINERRVQERNALLFALIIFLTLGAAVFYINRARKRMIERLAEKNIETQNLYEELKATQTQLVQSEKMISLGRLTAGIAHEINNPINFIAANIAALKLDFKDLKPLFDKAKALEKDQLAETNVEELSAIAKTVEVSFLSQEMNEIIEGMERGIIRTKDIIGSLRNFSRNAPEKFELADIHQALDSVLTILGHQLRDKQIKVEKEWNRIPMLACNIGAINQVFTNIIANAIQAVDSTGEGRIKITTLQDQDQVFIRIRDNGSGIPRDTLQKIFEPFYTTKEVGAGTGLGLSISYNIIQQHNGTIHVASEVGQGTTFSIALPVES
ncbi:MAG: ATP-binding protein [Bacteroidota bacterium]